MLKCISPDSMRPPADLRRATKPSKANPERGPHIAIFWMAGVCWLENSNGHYNRLPILARHQQTDPRKLAWRGFVFHYDPSHRERSGTGQPLILRINGSESAGFVKSRMG
jgi:hypothetical protein